MNAIRAGIGNNRSSARIDSNAVGPNQVRMVWLSRNHIDKPGKKPTLAFNFLLRAEAPFVLKLASTFQQQIRRRRIGGSVFLVFGTPTG